jgi:hypothetical protein
MLQSLIKRVAGKAENMLAETHGPRGYDAVQRAAALNAQSDARALGLPFTRVPADLELNSAAGLEGLRAEEPNAHL